MRSVQLCEGRGDEMGAPQHVVDWMAANGPVDSNRVSHGPRPLPRRGGASRQKEVLLPYGVLLETLLQGIPRGFFAGA